MSHDPMAEIRASFFIECEELLETLHDALAILDEGTHDDETINIIFRAVHSIKGGAGAFGLDDLVAFAHQFETVLDELRGGRLQVAPNVTRLFFQGADMLQDHVRAAQADEPAPDGSDEVLNALAALTGDMPASEEEVDFAPAMLSFDFGSDEGLAPEEAVVGTWQIEFTPHPTFYVSGNDPLLLLRSLAMLGDIDVRCLVPDDLILSLDHAETSRLGWQIDLTTSAERAEIEEIFEFVSDLCAIEIRSGDAIVDNLFAEDPVADDPPLEHVPPAIQISEDVPPIIVDITPPPATAQNVDKTSDKVAEKTNPTVRVDLERIDRLVNLVGELVINQAMLAQSVALAGVAEDTAVQNGLEEFMILTRDIQDSVMMIRDQPVKPLFQRMARIVREASGAVGKQVKLRTEGETTEVDKTVIERLADPLTHMIRNAIDHGLETAEQRLAAGKSPEGTVVLSARHSSGRVLIEISDDGAGINRDRVRATAIERKLIAADSILSDNEIDNLIFLPGFSTAKQVSALSGRGVGMDVVQSAITALGGRIKISSTPGQGSQFSISLPLTLAVLDGMVVRVADQTLVIPLSAIIETATLTPAAIKQVGAHSQLLLIRGDLVPLIDLGPRLGFRPASQRPTGAIVILVQKEDGVRSALIVDAIMEQRQVVIKGLDQNYGPIPGVAAATILGDGQIALILDPAGLTDRQTDRSQVSDLSLAG